MKNLERPRPVWASILIFMHIFLGLNGLYGGITLVLAPDGSLLGMPMSQLKNAPFSNFLIPGILLLLFLGIYPMAVAYSLLRRPGWRWPEAINPFKQMHWSWAGSLAAGVIAIVWIVVQIQWIQPGALHAFIFTWGVLIIIVTLLASVRTYCVRVA